MWKCAVHMLGVVMMMFSAAGTVCAGEMPFCDLSAGDADIRVMALAEKDMNTGILQTESGEQKAAVARACPDGAIRNMLNVLLVRGHGVVALVDTGYDWTIGELESALRRAGVGPESVTHVVITHAHGDHIGGLVRDGKPVFPSATILFSEKELAYWTSPEKKQAASGGARKIFDGVSVVTGLYGDRVRTFVPGTDLFPDLPGIQAVDEAGHTPGHVGIMAKAGDRTFLFWSDLLHVFDVQAEKPSISASFDMDPAEAARVRENVLNRVRTEGWLVVGSHVPFTQPRVLEKSGR